MLIAIVVIVAALLLIPKKGSKSPLQSLSDSVSVNPVSQRDADRKEALALIEAKLIEQDKQARFTEAVSVISSLSEIAKKVAK